MSYIWNEAAETMPYEQIRELQGQRLVQCVQRMYGKVSYYTEKMKAAGIEPGDIKSIDDLTRYSHLLTKKICARTIHMEPSRYHLMRSFEFIHPQERPENRRLSVILRRILRSGQNAARGHWRLPA